MTIDAHRLLTRAFAPIEHVLHKRDSQVYALALGLGDDPLDERCLRYVYGGPDAAMLQALPTLPNILGYPGFWAREADTGIDWPRLVHAEQEIELHGPVPVEGRLVGRNRVLGLWDKGAGKGALMQQERVIVDAERGEAIATVRQLSLLRGDGGFGEGGSPGAAPVAHPMPKRRADAVCELRTVPSAALLYRLCGDLNPLHADPRVASAAGFGRPPLHGMATMGVAVHAVLRTLLDYDASAIAAMRVRFTAAVYPGDTLRTEMWQDAQTVSLRTTAMEREAVVLDHACIRLRPAR